jgi:oligopeptide transport system substrate-binding protein
MNRKTVCFFAAAMVMLVQPLFAEGLPSDEKTHAVPDPDEQRVVTIIDSSHPYDLNPHTACYSSEAQVLNGLYEGLFSYDPITLDPLPAIATSYKVSRDKKRWTFTLTDKAVFSNGDPITAQTIYDSWMSLFAEPNASFASLLDCVVGVSAYRNGTGSAADVGIEVKDEHTLVVRLVEPAEHLSRILCHHAFAAVSKKPNVYSGAFVLQSYENGKLVMVKNEKYRDAANVFIPGITFIQSDDNEENTHSFNTGAADWVTGGVDTAKLLNRDAIHVCAEFGTQYLFFKGQNKPWNDPDIRAALLEAVPWEKLRKGYLVPATTLVYPLDGYPNVVGLTDSDAEDALAMMNDARKKLGIAQDEKLQLVFGIINVDYMKEQAELLKAAWEPLGVTVTVQTTPADRYNSSISGWNADLFSYTWIGDFADPLAFLELFRGGSTLNVSEYNSSRYNKLLDDAANAENSTEHYKFLSQAEQCLLDDGEIIPILHPVSLHAIDMNVIGGWTTNALDLHPLKYLYIKHTETKLPNLVMLNK